MTTNELKPGTPLPWRVSHLGFEVIGPGYERIAMCHSGYGTTNRDARYIVHACNAYPALTAERDRLAGEVAAMREALGDCQEAILHLDEGALGFAEQVSSFETGEDFLYPLRDELLAKIDAALTQGAA